MADDVIYAARPIPVGGIPYRTGGWWAMLGAIVTEAALFAYLLFSYYYVAIQPHAKPWPPEGPPSLHLALPNTIILILSSVCVWWGEQGAKRGLRGRLVAGLAVGFVLGAVFVFIQTIEWSNKTFVLSSGAYSSLYYTITGFHMAHVVVGLLVLLAVLVWSAIGYFGPVRHSPVSIGAIYWHFVDAVWITVFFTFYIIPYLS